MFNDEEDGLGVPRGLMNSFILMLLVFMVVGTIWELIQR